MIRLCLYFLKKGLSSIDNSSLANFKLCGGTNDLEYAIGKIVLLFTFWRWCLSSFTATLHSRVKGSYSRHFICRIFRFTRLTAASTSSSTTKSGLPPILDSPDHRLTARVSICLGLVKWSDRAVLDRAKWLKWHTKTTKWLFNHWFLITTHRCSFWNLFPHSTILIHY